MVFPDFNGAFYDANFPTHTDVLKYLHSFADHFNLNDHIKLQHMVIRVRPTEKTKWEIIAVNLANDKCIQTIHDAVSVCSGHFIEPFVPEIPDANKFQGKLIHSRDFRTAENFRGMM